jgi:hypothetical protein
MAYLRRNEHLKLLATWCNTLATAVLTVGLLSPIAEKFIKFDPKAPLDPNAWNSADMFLVCFMIAVILHLVGQIWIEFLKEDSE